MKKIFLAFAVCCVFGMYGMAANSDAKLNDIEMIEKKINALKAERKNIGIKSSHLMDEMEILIKRDKEFENKTKIPEIPTEKCFCSNSSKVLAKFENNIEKIKNDIEKAKWTVAHAKALHDIEKININIDKANIELIKVEIKAGKTPKIPLELANAVLKRNKSLLKLVENNSKFSQVSVKENEAKIKYVEASIKTHEAREKSTANGSLLLQPGLAELEIAEMMAKIKFEKVREEMARARIKDAEASVKYGLKPAIEFRKIYLKFDKVVDEKDFDSFLKHEY